MPKVSKWNPAPIAILTQPSPPLSGIAMDASPCVPCRVTHNTHSIHPQRIITIKNGILDTPTFLGKTNTSSTNMPPAVSHGWSSPPIAPLNWHDFIKKGQISFSGVIFTFYHKIHNIGKQYGVYTRKLSDICYGLSICPESHNGHLFSTTEYEDMAAALYKKLSDPNVIPSSYVKHRNIADRYAEDNDGYMVLYEILEDTHPMFKAPHLTGATIISRSMHLVLNPSWPQRA